MEAHQTGQHSCTYSIDALSPRYMRAKGLRAEGFIEVEHFWTGSVGTQTA